MPTDSAKTILCYGDSNTWGYNPAKDNRYPRSVRWPGALQRLLGNDHEVINEGLCGRSFVVTDPAKPHRTGITHLRSILESADPVDLIIVMLGTNDIKTTFNLTPKEIGSHLEQTIDFIRDSKNELEKIPKILVVCPPPVIKPKNNELDKRMVRGLEISRDLPIFYKNIATEKDCGFINAGDYVSFGDVDGYHFSPEGHTKFASVIAELVKKEKI